MSPQNYPTNRTVEWLTSESNGRPNICDSRSTLSADLCNMTTMLQSCSFQGLKCPVQKIKLAYIAEKYIYIPIEVSISYWFNIWPYDIIWHHIIEIMW